MQISYNLTVLILMLFFYSTAQEKVSSENFIQLDIGLEYGFFTSPIPSILGDSKICVLRINPKHYQFDVFSAKENKHDLLIASEWSTQYNCEVVVNAGMFNQDYSTHVGFLQINGKKNNDSWNEYKSVCLMNPRLSKETSFSVQDLEQTSIQTCLANYKTVIQNLRLIQSPRTNVWKQQNRQWSECAIGDDNQGNCIIVFSRSPYSMHDFNEIVLKLPLNIRHLQHLEGGPEASLYVRHPEKNIALMGSYETGFCESDANKSFWPIPVVIGIRKK